MSTHFFPSVLSAFLATCLLLAGCKAGDANNPPSDIETITHMSSERAKAFNNGDAAAIARYFAPDAYLMAPGKPAQQGRKAVEDYYQSVFTEYHTQLESGYESVVVDGNLAYGRGVAKVTLISKDGKDTLHSAAKYLNILERKPDGKWLTTHDIWNDSPLTP